ncbi:two-component sensor histidine kinase [Actinoplanes cyaneus]|uniref:Sensor-like histidine kinase SenX3 n=1 Tax=Actinoplanes cyaneus TaxID=52696 RepID=A0A919M0U6_9ACTN|nr:HAMP domain-containing sensor histidine kinase [Actinoplanes cyaneus]MCW2140195.1 His Kinase A (phospho-acceptor) domain-containing protein [Actinoplanes cyaneus]GID65510.1 two-component sensor histidine kinase [Actinoplanes cyaneus]
MSQTLELRAVRRARWRIGLLVGLSIGVLLTMAGAISYQMLRHSQEQQISRELDYGVQNGVIAGPPACSWVFFYATDGTMTRGDRAAPTGLPLRGDVERVVATGVTQNQQVDRDGTRYWVRTQSRGEVIVQAVFDGRFQLADRRHLLTAFLLAAAAGLLAAVLAAMMVGHRAVAPLVEALGRQRRFVADASHELRTPIAQVHTRAQLLARRAAQTGADRRDLDRLVSTTRRLGEIVDELLLSARLAADPGNLPPGQPVDLARLAAEETERVLNPSTSITLDVPPDPVLVSGVESALRRVVSELLANALTHTHDGSIAVAVRTVADNAELVVADTGDGFDPADAARIFDRFHRGAGAGDRRFGLGLALLREVVSGHGGTIVADGYPGVGATFTVCLPLAPRATRLPSGPPPAAGPRPVPVLRLATGRRSASRRPAAGRRLFSRR